MKGGDYFWEEMLDLPEIAYRLDRLGFSVTYCSSMSEDRYELYVKNPKDMIFEVMNPKYHSFIEDGFFVVPAYNFRIDLSDTFFEKKILETPSIKKQYNTDIIAYIKENQGDHTLFIVWLSAHILHDEPLEEGHNGGHVIIVSEITDDEVIIHDPWVPTLRYYPVSPERFLQAVQDAWEFSFIQVEYDHENGKF